jgi:hypothetical protein
MSHQVGDKASFRRIGTAEVLCFNGPCVPWTRLGCASCSVKPMKVYIGNNQSYEANEIRQRFGYGILISGQYRSPEGSPYYCLDNGAFAAWKNRQPWDAEEFLALASRYLDAPTAPDFVVVPDQVAKGMDSLAFSLSWVDRMPDLGARKYLAVQDGMTAEAVEDAIRSFDGLFVGGTLPWKYRTSKQWVELAHKHRRPCHIGRIGSTQRIIWAHSLGADSIDSTTWGRNRTYHKIEAAKVQEVLI